MATEEDIITQRNQVWFDIAGAQYPELQRPALRELRDQAVIDYYCDCDTPLKQLYEQYITFRELKGVGYDRRG